MIVRTILENSEHTKFTIGSDSAKKFCWLPNINSARWKDSECHRDVLW